MGQTITPGETMPCTQQRWLHHQRAYSSPLLRLHQRTALSLFLLSVTGSLCSVVLGQILPWVCNLNVCIIIIIFRACCLPVIKREKKTTRKTKNQTPKTPLDWPLRQSAFYCSVCGEWGEMGYFISPTKLLSISQCPGYRKLRALLISMAFLATAINRMWTIHNI